MIAVITKDGLIRIPRELQDQLGLQPGNELEVHNRAGTLVAWKRTGSDVFEKWRGRGSLPTGSNSDGCLRLIRDGDGG